MQLDHLNVLAAFLTIAEERSFTKAAKRLGVSRSALSHAVRGLEERLGVRLLARTTRSVAPTDAGEQLISRLRPALGEVESVLDQIVGLARPADGTRAPAGDAARPPRWCSHPSWCRSPAGSRTSSSRSPRRRRDARSSSPRGSTPVFTSANRSNATWWPCVCHAISGWRSSGRRITSRRIRSRASPHDLPSHRCINLRGGSAGPYRWEFEKDGETLVVDVSGPLIFDDADLMIRAAVDGLGLTFSFEEYVAPQIASGALVRVLEDWCPPFAGYFLYYPESAAAVGRAVSSHRDAALVDDTPHPSDVCPFLRDGRH